MIAGPIALLGEFKYSTIDSTGGVNFGGWRESMGTAHSSVGRTMPGRNLLRGAFSVGGDLGSTTVQGRLARPRLT